MDPGSPRFRRGVFFTSVGLSATLGLALATLFNFGAQEHALSWWHRLVHPRIDQAFGITPQDILRDRPGFKPVSAEKAAEVIKAYYNDGDNDSLGGSGGGSGQL